MHELPAELDDLLFEQLETLADIELGDGLAFQADEFPAGLVDGVDLLLKPPTAGGVGADRDNLRDAAVGVHHGRADQLEILGLINVEGELFGARQAERRGGIRAPMGPWVRPGWQRG